jgi:ADP-dependent NAD(P)H-hydrate dehydratase / NAD(P)H-hydrate epimerase
MQRRVYHSQDIQAWEQRWFAQQNSAYGLMQQAAWSITQQLLAVFESKNIQTVAVCCGQGNNAGDGYLVAKYLSDVGFDVDLYTAELGSSTVLAQAVQEAQDADLNIYPYFQFKQKYDAYIDALFGIGLNRELDSSWQQVILHINAQTGLKISIDIPSGLNANTGQPMPVAIHADFTYCVLGYKAGLFTGKGKAYSGEVNLLALIPEDDELVSLAELTTRKICLPRREAFGHKGNYGHVLVIGGHAQMGGAVIMAAEAAFAAGAGKVTIVCHAQHHSAILSRSPNIMLRDIDHMQQAERIELLNQVDAVCFGMGLGRDAWAASQYKIWFESIQETSIETVLDADALWFLAQDPQILNARTYCTPHPGEAATLLSVKTNEIEVDRVQAIGALQDKYQGQWVLKGAGSLTLEDQLYLCTAGNAGMGTGGMGDVLAGMIASLKAQFHHQIALHEIVMLHAQAGDILAEQGERGLQAQEMKHAIYQVVNNQ